jgi:hypothetical protein
MRSRATKPKMNESRFVASQITSYDSLMSTIDDPSNPADEMLRAFLAAQDAACPQCSYNLRGLHDRRCPECGEELVLRVNLTEPKQGCLIAGLVGLSAGAGLNGLLLIFMAIKLTFDRNGGGFVDRFGLVNGAGLLVEGTAMLLWIWRWRQIRRVPGAVRVVLMIGCWVLTLANLVFFSLTIR